MMKRPQRLVALACAFGMIATTVPTEADIYTNGANPVSRWLHSMPASCALVPSATAHGIGKAMAHDYTLPRDGRSEWLTDPHGQGAGVQSIRAYYDPAHKLAAFEEFGTDIGNFGIIADAPPPPAHITTRKDLSAITFGGNLHLGDTLEHVRSIVGPKSLQPRETRALCAGYSTVGFCSWKRAACECPPSPPYIQDKRLGMVVFHKGRVVAFAWDDGACGFG